MTGSWTLAVARDDFAQADVVDTPVPSPGAGEVLLRVARVGLTANNITYAVLGESLRYWQFFPPEARGLEPSRRVPPLWGFAEVAESGVPGISVGQRCYGYLPAASHLLVRPDRIEVTGFRDATSHRNELPSAYNTYRLTTGDPAYTAADEDLMILFRPLFFTSFMLADQLLDNDCYGATSLVLSSASSKTAYGTAFELHGRGPRLIGLTSAANVDFTAALGCYDEVRSYDELTALDPDAPTVYLDLSGSATTRAALRAHLGDRLVRDVAVGITTMAANMDAAQEMFFAPTQIRKRAIDWGRAGLDERFSQAWHRFVDQARQWVDVRVSEGPEGLRSAWLDVLGGHTPPRVGHVIQL